LASDQQYEDLLPTLWHKYQCDLRGPKYPDTSSPKSRVGVWQTLLYRWAHGMVGGIRDGLKPMPYLPLHSFNRRTGRYEKGDSQDFIERTDFGQEYINLDDLKIYLKETIGIPLPSMLIMKKSSNEAKQKLRPNQKHKIECRKVAKKIWDENPSITIADMILSDEISNVCEGKVYAEKTLHNWIKDLCPNRSPGRRPKKSQ
jgi:hypothetical protein